MSTEQLKRIDAASQEKVRNKNSLHSQKIISRPQKQSASGSDAKTELENPPTQLTSLGSQGWRPWGIGGSDIAAILGISPYRSAVEVWLDKVNQAKANELPDALPMRLGHFLEPFVVQEYERVTGNTASQLIGAIHHPNHKELFGHIDRMVTPFAPNGDIFAREESIVLECKTCSVFRSNEWGPSWSDLVPAEYLTQCLWYLGLTKCEEAHLAVLLGNTDFRIYRIRRDRQLEEHMFETAHKFWVEYVLKKVPPALKTRAQAELIHPAHVEGLSVEANPSTLQDISRYQTLQLELESIEKEIEGIKDGIALTLGSAERLTCDGHTLASWRLAKGANRLDTEKLRRERPDIVEKYSSKSLGSRRLLINTSKANSIHMEGV